LAVGLDINERKGYGSYSLCSPTADRWVADEAGLSADERRRFVEDVAGPLFRTEQCWKGHPNASNVPKVRSPGDFKVSNYTPEQIDDFFKAFNAVAKTARTAVDTYDLLTNPDGITRMEILTEWAFDAAEAYPGPLGKYYGELRKAIDKMGTFDDIRKIAWDGILQQPVPTASGDVVNFWKMGNPPDTLLGSYSWAKEYWQLADQDVGPLERILNRSSGLAGSGGGGLPWR
jgi:hypothetical protein